MSNKPPLCWPVLNFLNAGNKLEQTTFAINKKTEIRIEITQEANSTLS